MKRKWPAKIPVSGDFEVYSCPRGSAVKPDGTIDYPKSVDGLPVHPPILISRGTTSLWKVPQAQ
jgi:hypothetical protein